ncbi:helical backbone metal receptor [Caldisalinibacter kiritimatiensis]|uniref:Vitamin B12 ABC transporter, B12-binding component BtuF n=1 Tax=Caldisalinibacter kiritimatiensis TaxID=1304284 RepID=R1AUA2_9FIRM|nr:helical backbone metal receptor [Caldisalinibacter kiritimatiensis]EOD00743.1 Vitamin B12 ABC transporter, B12-binding component BtuF [Caldisalinibacter kiritimatiensis]
MKRNVKILSLLLVFLVAFSTISFASSVNLSLDGQDKEIITELKNGRTYVEENSLEQFGLEAFKTGDTAIVKNEEVEIKFTLNSNDVTVNGVPLTLDATSYVKEEKIYLPLRFILETVGYEIRWDGENQKVIAEKIDEISYPITFTDGDNKYTVDREPESIVSLAPSVTETLFAIGAGDRIKGRTQYCNYPEEALSIKEVGNMTDPNIETVIGLQPDMVIAATHYKEEVLNKFKQAGISIVAQSSPNSIDEMYQYIIDLGLIVNKKYEARALVSSLKAKVERTKEVTKYIPNNQRPAAYYVVGTGQWGEYSAGRDTFISEFISIAGGINVADDVTGWKYSLEKLIQHDPEIMFGPEFAYDTMKTGENYKALTAIQEENFVIVNPDIFSRPSPRAVNEGLKLLLEIFHENKIEELNF